MLQIRLSMYDLLLPADIKELKVIMKTPEWRHWHRSGIFIISFERISQFFLVFLLLTLNS